MAGTVALQNVTRVNAADAVTNWASVGGGATLVADTDIAIQGSPVTSITTKVSNKTNQGHEYTNPATVDVTDRVFLPKIIVTTYGSLSGGGARIRYGNSNTVYREWDYALTGSAYSTITQGVNKFGWWFLPVDPTEPGNPYSARDNGTPDFTTWDYYAHIITNNASSRSENVGSDAIDHCSSSDGGLVVTAGTVPSPATFDDFAAYDDDTTGNRYGFCLRQVGGLAACGTLRIANATSSIFNTTGETVTWIDAQVRAGFMRCAVDLQNASTDVDWTRVTLKSEGNTTTSDTRAALEVTRDSGTWGTFGLDACSVTNFRRLLLVEGVTFTGTNVFTECGQLDPVNSDYSGNMDLTAANSDYVYTQENLTLNSGNGGDFEIICYVAANDWTPTGNQRIFCHGTSTAAANFQIMLYIAATTGVLTLDVSDGTASTTLAATAAGFRDTTGVWLRVTYDQSAGQANFFYSYDTVDTPAGDVLWTANGTPTGTSRNIDNTATDPFYIGADPGGGALYLDGKVMYLELWDDGFRTPGASLGNLISKADWRTGADFTGSPATRPDDFATTAITWEEAGTSPTYTQGSNWTTPADLDSASFVNSTSEAAIWWNVNDTTPTELDDISWISSGTGHAIELGPSCPTSITVNRWEVTNYAGTDGSTGNEVIYNNSGKAITININDGIGTFSVRNGVGSSTTVVTGAVTLQITVTDITTTAAIEGARVLAYAATGGPLNADVSVSITRSGSTATVTQTGHGLATNDIVAIEGADQGEYNGVYTITVTGANTYTYTVQGTPASPATGSPVSSDVIISALTNVSGQVSDTRSYASNQPIRGFVRKGTANPVYKTSPLTGNTVSSTAGATIAVQLIRDS